MIFFIFINLLVDLIILQQVILGIIQNQRHSGVFNFVIIQFCGNTTKIILYSHLMISNSTVNLFSLKMVTLLLMVGTECMVFVS